ncbi:hypothetical protein OOT46_03560 [Aquabacterium sp. A7-Y]|uniref:hypothetical protein n=1 Tax=Aquabacterium sp. A7-Y TaxID=1349605 RepID=UPI00223E7F2B|nr:hypothetical protein [Aquabacterium sp. A7-Y]MCW7536929.1 hypothetical protein [Aquabacterium sp. A7-Y]
MEHSMQARALSLVILALSAGSVLSAPYYRAEQILLANGISDVGPMNDRGQVAVRLYWTADWVLWSPGGALVQFPRLAPPGPGHGFSRVMDLRNDGVAVGVSDTADINGVYKGPRGVIWQRGRAVDLGTLRTAPNGKGYSWATAVNDAGIVVGISLRFDAAGEPIEQHAVRWSNRGLQVLPSLSPIPTGAAEDTRPRGINEAGQIYGQSPLYAGGKSLGMRATLWDAQGRAINLGTLRVNSEGFGYSEAVDINEQGQVVGRSSTGGSGSWPPSQDTSSQATLWAHGEMTDLGALRSPAGRPMPSEAVDLNNRGQILVNAWAPGEQSYLYSGSSITALWDEGELREIRGPTTRMPQTGTSALFINDAGVIVGMGICSDSIVYIWDGCAVVSLDGQSYQDLNKLVDLPGWQLTWARDLNEAGQIVVHGQDLQFNQAVFLLTPVPELARAER